MTNDYLSLIQRNTIVAYASNGFQRASWCNSIVLMDASVKQISISVFANSAFEATHFATMLKGYLEANPMKNDQVSIGLKPPIWDPVQHAYRCDMIMMTGQLMVTQSRKPINYADYNCDFNCDFVIKKNTRLDKDTYKFQTTRAFSTAFINPSNATTTLKGIECH